MVAVIGDGGLTGGMAFEALNAAGDFRNDMTVILNDNNMSISATVGAFSKHFHKLTSSPQYNFLRSGAKELMNMISEDAKQIARKIEASLKPGTLFEEFGFRYFGPLDGNDLEALIPGLDRHPQSLRSYSTARGNRKGSWVYTSGRRSGRVL